MRLQYSSLPNVFLESFILYTAGQTLEKNFFFLFAWSVVQDTTLTGGAQPLAVGGSVRAQVSLLTPHSPVQRLNRLLTPTRNNTTAPPLSRRTAPSSSSFNFLLGKSVLSLGLGSPYGPGPRCPTCPIPYPCRRGCERVPRRLQNSPPVAYLPAQRFWGLSRAVSILRGVMRARFAWTS